MIVDTVESKETAVRAELNDQEIKMRLDLLCEVGRKVGSASQLTELVEQITKMTQRTLNASASSVLLWDEPKRELLFEVAEGQAGKRLRQIRLSAQSGIAGWVVRHGEPVIINDVCQDKRFKKDVDALTGFVTRSVMCVPLVVNRRIIGVIEVLNKLDGKERRKLGSNQVGDSGVKRCDKSETRPIPLMGRPRLDLPLQRIAQYCSEGLSCRVIARNLSDDGIQVSYRTIHRVIVRCFN